MGRRDTRFAILLCGLAGLAVACGPIGPLPGGRLSGEVATAPPADWSFSDEFDDVQLETRPGDPYSVNVWGAGIGDRFYLASGRGGEATWAQNMVEDPEVRLRVGDKLYELRASRIESEEERDLFLAALKRKYDFEPSEEEGAEAWLFRLDPR